MENITLLVSLIFHEYFASIRIRNDDNLSAIPATRNWSRIEDINTNARKLRKDIPINYSEIYLLEIPTCSFFTLRGHHSTTRNVYFST